MIKTLLKTQLGQNILANYLTVVWMGALTLSLIPVYLKNIGHDQWGIVAVCMSIQGFLYLLDAGLGQILPRDIAQTQGDKRKEIKSFFVFARIYSILAGTGFVIGQIAAGWLASSWLQSDLVNERELELAIRIILVQFLFQFTNNVHIGYWNGLQAQKEANLRQLGFGTLKHITALFLVLYWTPTAIAYLIPFAVLSFVECLFNRISILKRMHSQERSQPVTAIETWRTLQSAGGLGGAVLIGMLISQMDRIILSRSVSLVDFGIYVVVANLGIAFLQLQGPLLRAFLPRVASDAYSSIGAVWPNHRILWISSLSICVIPCLLVAFFSEEILKLWINDSQIVEKGAMPLKFILVAVAINGLYNVTHLKILALNKTRFLFFLNAGILLMYVLIVPSLARSYGILAGGFGWLLYCSLQLAAGSLFIRKSIYLKPAA
jgi:O-antigen/teichoic acid export membrane protein